MLFAVGRPGVRADLCTKLTSQVGGERLAALASASASFPTIIFLDLSLPQYVFVSVREKGEEEFETSWQ